MSTKTDKYPIDRKTKVMLLKAMARGYFEEADFEFLAQEYENDGIRYDNEELHGSVPIREWLHRFSKKETA